MTLTSADVHRLLSTPDAARSGAVDWVGILGAMLVVSVGRPWREQTPGLTGAATRTTEGVRVAGRAGLLAVRVDVRSRGQVLELDLEWRNDTVRRLGDLVLGLRVPGPDPARITMPHVVYHDNPSADADRPVPHVGRGGFVTEVHRLPIPAVCLQDDDGTTLTLAALPDADEDPDGRVHHGSLGAVGGAQTRALGLSGALLFDGRADVTYIDKARIEPTTQGYRELQPDGSLRQRFLVISSWAPPGHGFRELVRIGRDEFGGGETVVEGPLGDQHHIDLRLAALDARAFVDGGVAGYLKFPAWGEPRTRPGRAAVDFLYGWTGQCLRLAWCDARAGLVRGEPHRLERAHAVCDFYVDGSGTGVPGLRHNSYVHDDRRWQGLRYRGAELVSARAHGETLVDLADMITLYRRHGLPVPASWTTAVLEAADFLASAPLASGVLPIGWSVDGAPIEGLECSAGIPAVHAIAKAAAVLGDGALLERATTIAEAYHLLNGDTFDRPYSHSTLDAACEDKEGGLAHLELLMTLHDLTGEDIHLHRARIVADWLLTWVYHWNPLQQPGTPLRERGFDAVGWPGVSVQNHHVDVFFPSFDLWRLGVLTGDRSLQRWARTIIGAMGQGVCTAPGEWDFDVVGEQGEAFYVTGWQRPGRANTWNPSWVIAHPLWQLLRFAEQAPDLAPVGARSATTTSALHQTA